MLIVLVLLRARRAVAVLLVVRMIIEPIFEPKITRFYRAHLPSASRKLHVNRPRRVRAGPASSVLLPASAETSVRRPSVRRRHPVRPGSARDLQSCTSFAQATHTAPISAWSAPQDPTGIRTTPYCR